MSLLMMGNRVYMLENDESAGAFGKRLKHLRLLAELNRYQLAEKANINKSTLSHWEHARSQHGNPPTRKSIGKLLDAFKETGWVCSESWLLTGVGNPPIRIPDDIEVKEYSAQENIKLEVTQWTFNDEVKLFLKNKNAVVYEMSTNYMSPIFRAGDLVGGIWQSSNIINDEKICLIEVDNNMQVRRVKKSGHENFFNVSYFVYDKDQKEPFEINNVMLKEVAPIIRLWRQKI